MMPELPEVETIKRGLKTRILNKKIIQVEVREQKSFVGEVDKVVGRKVLGMERKGKALLIKLDQDLTLMIHLRMTGQLIYRPKGKEYGLEIGEIGKVEAGFAGGHPTADFLGSLPSKQTRVSLEFEEGSLFFNDQRKFGFIKLIKTSEILNESFLRKLGPEPWQMSGQELLFKLKRRAGSPIKGVILDQQVVAGIGNIYADEALFYAGIHPATKAGKLNLNESEKLIEGARKAMEASIEAGGSTMATYVRADGTKGDYLEQFAQVFQRQGQKCLRCGAEIQKIRVVGRGTHICPSCQKEKK